MFRHALARAAAPPLVAFAAGVALVPPARAAVPDRFGVVRLKPTPTSSGVFVAGTGDVIARGGTIAGAVELSSGFARAVRWDRAGNPTQIGDVPGATTTSSFGIGATQSGAVAGSATLVGLGGRAARWDAAGTATRLGDLPDVLTTNSTAYGISENGVAVGRITSSAGPVAVRWDAAGTAARLGNVAGATTLGSEAFDAADSGFAAGVATLQGENDRAIRWDAAGAATRLGTVDGATSSITRAFAVAENGAAAGEVFYGPFGARATRWDAAGVGTRLDPFGGTTTLNSRALGIVENGIAAGFATLQNVGTRAVLWDEAGGRHLLQDRLGPAFGGYTLLQANGLNLDGPFLRTVAFGADASGTEGLYLLTGALPGSTYLGGDADLDGDVDFADLAVVAVNYAQANVGRTDVGDFDLDGDTDFADLATLAANYGQDLTPAQRSQLGSAFAGEWALAVASVPEPATAGALLAITAALALRRRRSA